MNNYIKSIFKIIFACFSLCVTIYAVSYSMSVSDCREAKEIHGLQTKMLEDNCWVKAKHKWVKYPKVYFLLEDSEK